MWKVGCSNLGHDKLTSIELVVKVSMSNGHGPSVMTLKRDVPCHSINILDVARYTIQNPTSQLPLAQSIGLNLHHSTGNGGVSI